MKAVIDTNILIDYLNGVTKAKEELDAYDELYISLITWMEILIGAESDEDAEIREFLRRFRIHPVDEAIAARTVSLKREQKLRLPDAIIWATARELGLLLVTRNTRDFPSRHPGFRVPYKI